MNNTSFQRDVFIEEIFKAAKNDRDIFFVSADFGAPSLDRFREELPRQFVHSGISEQHMMDMAAGFALAGKKVYVYAMAPFISLRSIEQTKCGPGLMNLPICVSYVVAIIVPLFQELVIIELFNIFKNIYLISLDLILIFGIHLPPILFLI